VIEHHIFLTFLTTPKPPIIAENIPKTDKPKSKNIITINAHPWKNFGKSWMKAKPPAWRNSNNQVEKPIKAMPKRANITLLARNFFVRVVFFIVLNFLSN